MNDRLLNNGFEELTQDEMFAIDGGCYTTSTGTTTGTGTGLNWGSIGSIISGLISAGTGTGTGTGTSTGTTSGGSILGSLGNVMTGINSFVALLNLFRGTSST